MGSHYAGPWGRPMPPRIPVVTGGWSPPGQMPALPIARFAPPPTPLYVIWVDTNPPKKK